MRRRLLPLTAGAMLAALAGPLGCGGHHTGLGDRSAAGTPVDSPPDPLDPESCAGCHTDHFHAWSGSMHAYASDDPVFVAMNARGQRETGAALGTFCVRCHAPIAVALGATNDGLNLATLPRSQRGVTCVFCHTVDAIDGVHNGAVRLAGDGVMRGPILDPVPGLFHASTYSPLHDRARLESASLCGACHDVRNTAGVDIERTFAEWQTTAFAHSGSGEQRTCGVCHMPETRARAATVPGAPVRPVHDHAMAGLDVALVAFPEADAQRRAVQSFLDAALSARLCVSAPGAIDVALENTRIGHAWPSGATHDRRAWIELAAYTAGVPIWSSGQTPTGAPPDPVVDPTAVLLRDVLFDARGTVVPFLWQAASTQATVLAPAATGDPSHSRALVARFTAPPATDRVTMRVHVTAIAPEILDALVSSGDLDRSVRANVPVFSPRTTMLEWTADRGYACLP
jgi:hypothetical protein